MFCGESGHPGLPGFVVLSDAPVLFVCFVENPGTRDFPVVVVSCLVCVCMCVCVWVRCVCLCGGESGHPGLPGSSFQLSCVCVYVCVGGYVVCVYVWVGVTLCAYVY